MVIWLAIACTPKSNDVDTPPVTPPPSETGCTVLESWDGATMPAPIQAAFEQELAENGAHGVTFAILIDGEIRYAGALGTRDPETSDPMEPDTLLRSGSTLKMQTAAALIAQAARGDLALNETISTYLPDFSMALQPGEAEGTTLHELLSHQGAFYDYTPIDGPNGDSSLYNHAHNVFAETYFMMAPAGSFWNYSNPNFSMAGLVAQEAAGRPYATVMAEDVWAPLCMDRTFLTAEQVLADGDHARSTSTNWETGVGTVPVEPESYDHGFSKPAGFAWTSTMDMLKFADFVISGNDTIAPGGEHLWLTQAHADTLYIEDATLQYGYGVFLWDRYPFEDTWKSLQLWEHGGDIPGYAADLWMLPEHGIAIAVLASGDGAHFSDSLAATVQHLVNLEDAPAPADTFDLDQLDGFAGAYEDPWNLGSVVLTRDGDALAVSALTLDEFNVPYSPTMTPLSGRTMLWEVDGFQLVIDFVPGPSGAAHFIRHRIFVVERNVNGDAAPDTIRPQQIERFRQALARQPIRRR